jgi:putative ABC transport system ATP-binding protein
MSTDDLAVEAIDVVRTHGSGARSVRSLDGVSLCVARGEVVSIMGPSGSGKSTLLFLLGGLDTPDAGVVRVAGIDWSTMRGSQRARFRRRACGFIVQGQALLPQATAAENVEVPLLLDGVEPSERARRVAEGLIDVGLGHDAAKLTDQLSGGQQQRVAIARALVPRPAVVLADEPTASLDSVAAQTVVRLLVDAARAHGAAVVLVTHDPTIAAHADRIVELHSGRVRLEERVRSDAGGAR